MLTRRTIAASLVGLIVGGVVLASASPAAANGNCVTYWGGRGAGTAGNPYPVATQLDLDEVRYCLSATFAQTADIALAGAWTPLGSNVTAFSGAFDGNDFQITGLSTTDPAASEVGLFGVTSGATITDTHVSGAVSGYFHVGGLVGDAATTTITGSSAAVAISMGNGTYSPLYVGGLVGSGSALTVTDSTASGALTRGAGLSASAGSYTGGLVGSLTSGTITGAQASGAVNGAGYSGGMIGFLQTGTLSSSSASGNVTGTNYVGGLIGSHWIGTLTLHDTSSSGDVSGDYYVGGLLGQASAGSIVRSTSVGNVTGNYYVGGLIGYHGNGTLAVADSSGTGAVVGQMYTGGLVGQFSGGTIGTSSATGTVTGTANTGGLVGYLYGANISDSFAEGTVTGTTYVGGLAGSVDGAAAGQGRLHRVFALGAVTGSGYVGGLIGQFGASGADTELVDAYAHGSVAVSSSYAGSLFGLDWNVDSSDVRQRAYGIGPVTGSGTDRGGALGGGATATWSSSLWNIETTGIATALPSSDIAGLSGSTTSVMTNIGLYQAASWSISDTWVASGTTWGICPRFNNGYPFLMFAYDTDPCPPAPPANSSTSGGAPTYVVDLDAQGGTCEMSSVSGAASSWVALPTREQCSKTAFSLAGWNTSRDNTGTFILPGASTQLAGDNTMFAIWLASAPLVSPVPIDVEPEISVQATRLRRAPLTFVIRGTSQGVKPGSALVIYTRKRGQSSYNAAGTAVVSEKGTFTWRGVSRERMRVFVTRTDGAVRSAVTIIPRPVTSTVIRGR